MTCVIDVGANAGEFGLELAKRRPDVIVHLIEPARDLVLQLQNRVLEDGLGNVFVHDVAVANMDGQASLGISLSGDRGTSSLLAFDEEKIKRDPYWATRSDLQHETSDQVEVRRLEALLDEWGVASVRFIKIDVQGLDLAVLKSAGRYLNQIDAGVLEVTAVPQGALYKGEVEDLRQALNFLCENEFAVMAIKPNDPASNEFNVFFCRDFSAWSGIIEELGLENMPAFDGKNYWHFHSNSPVFSDSVYRELSKENSRLCDRIEVLDGEISRLNARIRVLDEEIRYLQSK